MHSALTVHELGLTEFISGLDQIIAVYAAAMQAPAERLGSRRSIMVGHTGNPNFRAFGAFDAASGELAGFCYGFRGQSGQWWHDTVEFELAAARGLDLATQWLEHSYEVAELHVRPAYQGRGAGKSLLLRLADGRPERTALLSTRDAESPARLLYRGVGFVDLLTGLVFSGNEPPYAVMGAELPLRPR